MRLANSAPKVGAATAERAPQTEAATASAARPSEAPLVDKAPSVEPSVTDDDPRALAPKDVKLIHTYVLRFDRCVEMSHGWLT
jgi:hypothetical protein